MFTGIVEHVGEIRGVEDGATTRRFRIGSGPMAAELSLGDSVAVDGACFTVAALEPDGFAVDVIGTSLARTIARDYRIGTRVNLERALRATGRIDGHLVQGHVDGLGHLIESVKDGEFWRMAFEIPEDVAALTVPRGSITINGVSLTVAELEGERRCHVGIVPFTHAHTNLGGLAPGDPVNVEGDLIGKYVGRILAARPRNDER